MYFVSIIGTESRCNENQPPDFCRRLSSEATGTLQERIADGKE